MIAQVEVAILSTKTPQNPTDKISRILCDADLMNLTFDDYFEQIDLMRREWGKVGKAKLNSHEFYLSSLEFFQSHEYHSEYGRKVLQPKKENTERKIRNMVA
jgi:predicted metal-dependent HD superfamily phosphohydrolase